MGIAAKVGEQFNFGMGYLSSRNFDNAAMNWIAEGVNSVGQCALLLGAVLLHKSGLAVCNSQTASPLGCLNNFYSDSLSDFLGSIQTGAGISSVYASFARSAKQPRRGTGSRTVPKP